MSRERPPTRDTRPRALGPAVRRTLLAGLGYAILAVVVAVPLADFMNQALLLPPMFAPLVRGLLMIIGGVVLVAAWRYPEVGDRGDSSSTPQKRQ